MASSKEDSLKKSKQTFNLSFERHFSMSDNLIFPITGISLLYTELFFDIIDSDSNVSFGVGCSSERMSKKPESGNGDLLQRGSLSFLETFISR